MADWGLYSIYAYWKRVYFQLYSTQVPSRRAMSSAYKLRINHLKRQLAGYFMGLLALTGTVHVKAQTTQTTQGQADQARTAIADPYTASNTLRTFNMSTVGLKGTPLAVPNWAPGELTLEGGKTIRAGLFNYDVYSKLVAVKRSPRDSVVYDIASVMQLTLQPGGGAALQYEHVPDLITNEANLKTDLLRIIHKGTYSLVEQPVKTFVKAPTKQTYGGLGEVSNEYRDESVYYLIRPDRTAERVKLNRKSLIRALKEKGESVERYLKANSIDLKTEADVAKALASLDQK